MTRPATGHGLRVGIAAMALAVACGGPQRAGEPARTDRYVIVVTVDGMVPATYTEPDAHGLKVPVLRELARTGAASDGALSVFPSVTYPAHTSIATGAWPGTHGIVSNYAWDPPEKNQGGWRWYAEDIRVPTLWDRAAESGYTTALVNWPVTVGARATVVIPEYWRAGTSDDTKLTRVLSTPGVLDEVAARHPDLWQRFTPPNVRDSATIDVAVHLIETRRPNVLFIHIWQTDDAQHATGLWSPESNAALEHADEQIGRLIDAAKRAGTWDRTILVVASDHGFGPVASVLKPGVALAEAGLVTLDADGKPGDWRAHVLVSGPQAYVYVRDAADAPRAAELFAALAADPESGVARVYDAAAIRDIGGDPDATLALEAAPGWTFAAGYTGARVSPPVKLAASHGWDPRRPEMRASLIVAGPPVTARRLEDARLIDVAPTLAAWLGIALPAAQGRSLLDAPAR
jgi:predicted AlkP superfamily pyrophosphatase or phosphodiesterase